MNSSADAQACDEQWNIDYVERIVLIGLLCDYTETYL